MANDANHDNDLNIQVVRLKPEHKFSGLKLGHENFAPLKTFIRKVAQDYESQRLARTYVALLDEVPKAYISIVSGEIATDNPQDNNLVNNEDYPYKHYPALKIARLAVDSRMRGTGIGTILVDLALGVANERVCPWVGCRFVVVDAKKESVKFYEKYGFTLLDTPDNRNSESPIMFIDLLKAGE
ncbi:GNAT family N-acetyltransferase [Oricola sp.]|uniref:GNAT family N-acetyltransferase n=1 Tax=Oricola sp. TaxID=1979950 RepID=UPI003BAAB498